MSNEKSALLKKLSKTLAVTVPALAMSGFVPIASFNINSAIAEGDYEDESYEEDKSTKKDKSKSKK